jgi:small-conductance mechanosensitive channel
MHQDWAAFFTGLNGRASVRISSGMFWEYYFCCRSGAVYFISGHEAFGISAVYAPLANHPSLAILLSAFILAAQKSVDLVITHRARENSVTIFNLRQVVRLLAIILVSLVVLSAVSQTWYTLPIALGIFSIVIGFALQTPMTSFVGWIYILVRRPYNVGDRIKIDDATGDAIDVSYFDTTLWEFGGQYLSTDHPSGRVIKFPNSTVLSTPVYNYSWELSLISGTRYDSTSPITATWISSNPP